MTEVLEKNPIGILELKKELAAIKKRDGELNFRSQRTEEYVNELAKLSQKDTNTLIKKIRDLELPRLKEEHIRKIVDIVPQNEKQLKVILSGYTLTVNAENMKKIMAALKDSVVKK